MTLSLQKLKVEEPLAQGGKLRRLATSTCHTIQIAMELKKQPKQVEKRHVTPSQRDQSPRTAYGTNKVSWCQIWMDLPAASLTCVL